MTQPRPYRRPFPSRPEVVAEPIPETVYQALHDHEQGIADLTSAVGDFRASVGTLTTAVASLDLAVKEGKASGRSETNKLIVTVVLAALGVLGGNKLVNPNHEPAPTPPAPQRSALDIQLDVCRRMQPGSPSAVECKARVVEANP